MTDLSSWRPQLDDALAQGWDGHTFTDIQEGVNDGTFQAWTSPHSIVITQINVYPQFKQIFVFLASGNLAEIEVLAETIRGWAKEQGCTRALFIGRPGWERTFLSRTGWQSRRIIHMEREI